MSTTTSKPLFHIKLHCDTACSFVDNYPSPQMLPFKDCLRVFTDTDVRDHIKDLESPLTVSMVRSDGKVLSEAVFSPLELPPASPWYTSRLCVPLLSDQAGPDPKFLPAEMPSAASTLPEAIHDSINLSIMAAEFSVMPNVNCQRLARAIFEIHPECSGAIFRDGPAATGNALATVSTDPELIRELIVDLDTSSFPYANREYAGEVREYLEQFWKASSPPVSYKKHCICCFKSTVLGKHAK